MKSICTHAGILNEKFISAIDKVDAACEICARHGRPLSSTKISLTHVNEAFNEEIQIDFTFCDIQGEKHKLMVITDTGTGYTEAQRVISKDMNTIVLLVEVLWICRHGASKKLSADDEYHRNKLTTFLNSQDIEFKPRSARRHNKVGIVERKNGILKNIIHKLDADLTTASIDTIVACATFLSNLFSGSRLLSSFQLVRGYSPATLGLPNTQVTEELLDAHKEQVSTRALQRLLHSRKPNSPAPDLFKPGDDVWIFCLSTEQNEKVEWIKAKVVKPEQHYLVAGRSKRGPPMRAAYEDVRVALKGLEVSMP